MPVEFSRTDAENGAVTLALSGSLDAITATEVRAVVDDFFTENKLTVTVDLAGLDLIDSSGVAVLVALYKRMRAVGGTVTVTGARDQPLAIFRLLRMDRVFSLN